MESSKRKPKLTYADSGVDIKAGETAVDRIKHLAGSTFNSQVLTGLGSFGGFFRPDMIGLKQPVFISSCDGVGTKLKLAFMTGRHNTVGEDLVNHCINDILVHGAKGLFFLDYIAVGKLDPDTIVEVISGMSRGCKNAGVALIGGEMAEMHDFYQPGEYDIAGFIVGMVDEDRIINGSTIEVGDVCIGLSSNGLHTNGYTLARTAVFEAAGLKPNTKIDKLGMTVADALLAVHRCYAPLIHPLLGKFEIHGMAHITGGGIPGNLKRILPDHTQAEISRDSWPVLPLFDFLREAGDIDSEDMYSAFNMGIGYILVVPPLEVDPILAELGRMDEMAYRIGRIVAGEKSVRLVK